MSHIPLSLWSWQETIKSVFSGKVTVVDVYPDVYVRAANIKMPLPSVIALTEYAPHARGQVSDTASSFIYCLYRMNLFQILCLFWFRTVTSIYKKKRFHSRLFPVSILWKTFSHT